MVTRANVKPALITWARERAGIPKEELSSKFKNLPRWEEGDLKPTLKQLDAFASAVHVPVGYLFLSKPPKEVVPIPDFRTVKGRSIARPSPNLLDTIYICQERQAWYRDYARMSSLRDLDFVASVSTADSPRSVAEQIRDRLGFDLDARNQCPTWSDALRFFIRQAESAGILVMVSGIVMNNSHRPLETEEFRGFALCDSLAPLIFVNGRDTRAAQMFTVAHELAHIWLGHRHYQILDPLRSRAPGKKNVGVILWPPSF